MTSPTTCKLGQIDLDADDLIFSDHLLKPILNELDITINSDLSYIDNSKYISALNTGDKVLITQISDNVFAVLERLVSTKDVSI